ncbi:MAG TPA: LacI family DNA-binding transcriptional regulator [Gemmatimonadaceae bacterium]|nr:LacI family DNA-binding transcriptional regulator [Gemmatimonadaceae bacterium]
MRVTIRQVAREAGVSVATVSRVLNASGPVSAETSRRIRDVAARLRYAPNEAARALTRSRTHTIGVLLPDIYGEFFSEVIRGIDQRTRREGYHLLVSGSHDDPAEMEAALSAMRGRVDGLLLMFPDAAAQASLGDLAHDVPFVLINGAARQERASVVAMDNAGGARAVVRHLLALGHTRIATITGAPGNSDAAERLRGYREALRAARVERPAELEVAGDFTEDGGHLAMRRLLELSDRPTAVFAANDSMAIGALGAVREAGLVVPDDVAVVGFDDIPIARYVTPPLSSIRVAIDELGRLAAERLFEALEAGEDHRPTRDVLPAQLIVRGSCGATLPRAGPAHAPP